jgi:hypothetical protein
VNDDLTDGPIRRHSVEGRCAALSPFAACRRARAAHPMLMLMLMLMLMPMLMLLSIPPPP